MTQKVHHKRKCTAPAQEWIMGVIISLWIFSRSCASLPGPCSSGSTAALQFAAEEEGVVRLALSDPETLEGQGGAGLPCKGWRGLHPSVYRVWGQAGRGKQAGEGHAYETGCLWRCCVTEFIRDSTSLRCLTTGITALCSHLDTLYTYRAESCEADQSTTGYQSPLSIVSDKWLILSVLCYLSPQHCEAIEKAQAEIQRLRLERERYEESMKKAFMRGVCALNMEALSMFHTTEERPEQPPVHDQHGL